MVIALVVITVLVVVAACVVGYLFERRRREQQLRDQFGSEYDRTLGEAGDRRSGERELLDRQKRHEQLDIRPLDASRADDYRAEWQSVQKRFVDDPEGAVHEADALIEALMSERGYPIGDFDMKLADLSVQHADVLQHYRAAHEIATAANVGEADTEALRRAMVHYRALFASLLDDSERAGADSSATDRKADTRATASRRTK